MKEHCEHHFCRCEHWHNHIRGCGRRMTMPRSLIIEFMSKNKGHFSAEEIFLKLKEKEPAIGIATVYRTLELLTELGIVGKFDFGDGRARYEYADGKKSPGHHHHLVCTKCNRIIDYDDFSEEELSLIKRTEEVLNKKYNFKITNHMIQFYGICDDCRKGEKNENSDNDGR